MNTIQEMIDKHWDELFDEILKVEDDLYDLTIEYKGQISGLTVKRSWRDRDRRLAEDERQND